MVSRKKPKQIRWTVPCGNAGQGRECLARWKSAARRVKNNKRLKFNEWIRETLDAAATLILQK